MKINAKHICDICSETGVKVKNNNKNGRPQYPQPHNIRVGGDVNGALKQRFIERLHGVLKYTAKNNKNKQPRRLYD